MQIAPTAIVPTTFRKLNLGCGFDHRDGYVNVDLNDFHNPDVVADVSDMQEFPSGFYEEIIAQDVLEHMARDKSKVAFTEWSRLLSPTGVLKLRVPTLIGLLKLLNEHPWTVEAHEHIMLLMFGTQAYNGDFHLTSFTPPILLKWAAEAGVMVTSASVVDGWLHDVEFAKIRTPTDEEYVQQLYYSVLGRPADPDGFNAHVSALRAGGTRDDTLAVFVSSPEAKTLPGPRPLIT